MTLEAFNLLLAAGGGVVVPTSVGVIARHLVRKQDQPWRTALAASTNRATQHDATAQRSSEAAVHEDRVPA